MQEGKARKKKRRRRERWRSTGTQKRAASGARSALEEWLTVEQEGVFVRTEAGEEKREYRRGQRSSARKRVVELRKNGQTVIRVGTGSRAGGRRKSMQVELLQAQEATDPTKAAGTKRGDVVRVMEGWVSGSLTNHEGLSALAVRKKEMLEQNAKWGARKAVTRESGRKLEVELGKKAGIATRAEGGIRGIEEWLVRKETKRPGVRVIRNPEEHSLARKEAVRCGIPTVGRVTKKRSKESAGRRTYGRKHMQGEEGRVRRGRRRQKALRMKTSVSEVN